MVGLVVMWAGQDALSPGVGAAITGQMPIPELNDIQTGATQRPDVDEDAPAIRTNDSGGLAKRCATTAATATPWRLRPPA